MPATATEVPLGVHLTAHGGRLAVWSANATAMEVCLFDRSDADWVAATIPLERADDGLWIVESRHLEPGVRYTLRADGPEGPGHVFDPGVHLLDPYARGLVRSASGEWRGYVQEEDPFDWGHARKPRTPLDHTVVYEAHVKGLTKLNPAVPEELRGTYAGLAHESTIRYLKDLGVTAVELLPVHQFVSEQRLIKQGLINYWGYNTLNFFTPHAAYASRAAQLGGTGAILREFKGMVRNLHEAGLEVFLDVVYNHTAEEGLSGPTSSFRGLDNRSYYRQTEEGEYVDTTGCGNALNTANPAAARLVLDSLRYWAEEVQIDGFRFDLAVTLARDAEHEFDPEHPLIRAIGADPQLGGGDGTVGIGSDGSANAPGSTGTKLIAEPWDVGLGGWQVGHFPDGWSEWNDGFRDRMRRFWLTDIGAARTAGAAPEGIGTLARRIAGSEHVFARERGPLASVNFVTAHDGFTLADVTAYNEKHNLGNGEDNRDGASSNLSFNHGVEGPTRDQRVLNARRKAMRNLLGTLLLSSGVPMLTAGDEMGRSQRGNNNAYNQDSELTWLPWELQEWQNDLLQVARDLTRLRRENPALRPVRYGVWGETVPSATQMDWYNKDGRPMTMDDWDSPAERTLQYLAASTPEFEAFNRILLVVHGLEEDVEVVLPAHEGVESYTQLWDSSVQVFPGEVAYRPGMTVPVHGTSIQLYVANGLAPVA
ncbi:MAG: glycogen debranching enzyme [Microbacteriaceae bacterium]|nr:glycogen debranching enzyme [Microbacteriaceae bacterium]